MNINSNNTVVLGAGATYTSTCDENISVTPLTSFDSSDGTYKLTTISISDIGDGVAPTCDGRILSLGFLHTSGNQFASWTLPTDNASNKYDFGGTSGGTSGGTYFATATFAPLSAAGLTSIALSIR